MRIQYALKGSRKHLSETAFTGKIALIIKLIYGNLSGHF